MIEKYRKDKIACSCGWHGLDSDLVLCDVIRKDNKDPVGDISLCPECLDAESLMFYCCDEFGCWKEIAAGTPTKEGYRLTCQEHVPKEDG